jgi:hypothetical protein
MSAGERELMQALAGYEAVRAVELVVEQLSALQQQSQMLLTQQSLLQCTYLAV